MPESVRDRIKQRLQESGLTRRELARRLKTSDRNLENWLTGVVEEGSLPLRFIAGFIREIPTNPEWLLTGRGTPDAVPESEAAQRLQLVRDALDRPLPPESTGLPRAGGTPVPRRPSPGRGHASG